MKTAPAPEPSPEDKFQSFLADLALVIARHQAHPALRVLSAPIVRIEEPLDRIAAAVCDAFGISLENVLSRDNSERIYIPRMVIFFLARELTRISSTTIGSYFQRDHGTILHAVKRIAEKMDVEPIFKNQIQTLRRNVKEALAS